VPFDPGRRRSASRWCHPWARRQSPTSPGFLGQPSTLIMLESCRRLTRIASCAGSPFSARRTERSVSDRPMKGDDRDRSLGLDVGDGQRPAPARWRRCDRKLRAQAMDHHPPLDMPVAKTRLARHSRRRPVIQKLRVNATSSGGPVRRSRRPAAGVGRTGARHRARPIGINDDESRSSPST